MLKFRVAFYLTALGFAVLVNNGIDTTRVANWLNGHEITAEQLSNMAESISTLN
jgi:hypothetical protein